MDIHPLTLQDLPSTRHLQPEGWGDITIYFMEYCLQSFCRPVKVVFENKIIGVGALILHQNSAWLGHIIVDESYRGRGIGFKIVKHLIDLAAKNGAMSISLIATDLGSPVYKKAGFKTVGAYQFFKREHVWSERSLSDQLLSATPAQYEQILELDQQINGEVRRELIDGHLNRAIIFKEGERVEGYYFPQLGQGPIYATTERAGMALMELKYSTTDTAVIPKDNTIGNAFLKDNGFLPQDFTAIRMVYGTEIQWFPKQIYSRIGGNYG